MKINKKLIISLIKENQNNPKVRQHIISARIRKKKKEIEQKKSINLDKIYFKK